MPALLHGAWGSSKLRSPQWQLLASAVASTRLPWHTEDAMPSIGHGEDLHMQQKAFLIAAWVVHDPSALSQLPARMRRSRLKTHCKPYVSTRLDQSCFGMGRCSALAWQCDDACHAMTGTGCYSPCAARLIPDGPFSRSNHTYGTHCKAPSIISKALAPMFGLKAAAEVPAEPQSPRFRNKLDVAIVTRMAQGGSTLLTRLPN